MTFLGPIFMPSSMVILEGNLTCARPFGEAMNLSYGSKSNTYGDISINWINLVPIFSSSVHWLALISVVLGIGHRQ